MAIVRNLLGGQRMTTPQEAGQTLGNAIKFNLEFMMMMLHSDRNEEAARAYDRIIALCDQAGQPVRKDAA
jgi:hypothetical protein